MQVDSFNYCACWVQVRTKCWKEHLVKVSTLRYSSLEPYFRVYIQSFTFIVLGCNFCRTWIPRAVLFLSAKNRKLPKIRYGREMIVSRRKRQSSTCCRDCGTKEWESEGGKVIGLTKHLIFNDTAQAQMSHPNLHTCIQRTKQQHCTTILWVMI